MQALGLDRQFDAPVAIQISGGTRDLGPAFVDRDLGACRGQTHKGGCRVVRRSVVTDWRANRSVVVLNFGDDELKIARIHLHIKRTAWSAGIARPVGQRGRDGVCPIGERLGGAECPLAGCIDRRRPDDFTVIEDSDDGSRLALTLELRTCVIGNAARTNGTLGVTDIVNGIEDAGLVWRNRIHDERVTGRVADLPCAIDGNSSQIVDTIVQRRHCHLPFALAVHGRGANKLVVAVANFHIRSGRCRALDSGRGVLGRNIRLDVAARIIVDARDGRSLRLDAHYAKGQCTGFSANVVGRIDGAGGKAVLALLQRQFWLEGPGAIWRHWHLPDDDMVVQNFDKRHLPDFSLAAILRLAVIGQVTGVDLTDLGFHVIPEDDVIERRCIRRKLADVIGLGGLQLRHVTCEVSKRSGHLDGRCGSQLRSGNSDLPCVANDFGHMLVAVDRYNDLAAGHVRRNVQDLAADGDLALQLCGIENVVVRDVVHDQLRPTQVRRRHVQSDNEAVAVCAFVAYGVDTGCCQLVFALVRQCGVHHVVPLTILVDHRAAYVAAVVVHIDGVTGSALAEQFRGGVVSHAPIRNWSLH